MIGFIGAGNMGSAIMNGLISSGVNPSNIYLYDTNQEKLKNKGKKGIIPCNSNIEVVKESKYIFIAVKPYFYENVLNEIKDYLSSEHVVISIAAGVSISFIKSIIGDIKVVRIMPNTPSLVKKGFAAICFDNLINNDEKMYVLDSVGSFSTCQIVKEKDMDIYSSVTGSGPAYVFMMIEAMADAAVLLGIPRNEAYRAAAATVLGSAEMVLKTSMHPGELKDMVCSPRGTTIEGVRTLEERGFRSSIIECIINTYKKNIDMNNIR